MRTKYMPNPDERLELISVKVPSSMISEADKLARFKLCSRSDVVRTALLAAIRRHHEAEQVTA